jgi:hypothetical protein
VKAIAKPNIATGGIRYHLLSHNMFTIGRVASLISKLYVQLTKRSLSIFEKSFVSTVSGWCLRAGPSSPQ